MTAFKILIENNLILLLFKQDLESYHRHAIRTIPYTLDVRVHISPRYAYSEVSPTPIAFVSRSEPVSPASFFAWLQSACQFESNRGQ